MISPYLDYKQYVRVVKESFLNFKGVMNRPDFVKLNIIFLPLLVFLAQVFEIFDLYETISTIIVLILLITLILPSNIRRMRDTGHPGWFGVVVGVSIIFHIFLLVASSEQKKD